MTDTYRFLTRWQFAAPIDRVWAMITDVERYPEWWPGVREARVLGTGVERRKGRTVQLGQVSQLAVRGALPYTLRFRTEVVDFAAPERLVVRSSGDLIGRGEWNLTPVEGGTEVTYLWEVTLEKPVFSLLSRLPGVRRLLESNHDRVMAQGSANLSRLLAAEARDNG